MVDRRDVGLAVPSKSATAFQRPEPERSRARRTCSSGRQEAPDRAALETDHEVGPAVRVHVADAQHRPERRGRKSRGRRERIPGRARGLVPHGQRPRGPGGRRVDGCEVGAPVGVQVGDRDVHRMVAGGQGRERRPQSAAVVPQEVHEIAARIDDREVGPAVAGEIAARERDRARHDRNVDPRPERPESLAREDRDRAAVVHGRDVGNRIAVEVELDHLRGPVAGRERAPRAILERGRRCREVAQEGGRAVRVQHHHVGPAVAVEVAGADARTPVPTWVVVARTRKPLPSFRNVVTTPSDRSRRPGRRPRRGRGRRSRAGGRSRRAGRGARCRSRPRRRSRTSRSGRRRTPPPRPDRRRRRGRAARGPRRRAGSAARRGRRSQRRCSDSRTGSRAGCSSRDRRPGSRVAHPRRGRRCAAASERRRSRACPTP